MSEENTKGVLFQLIDGEGEFASKEEVEKQVRTNKINDIGFNYYVVAVLGCQSSGKSTLLNLLFGTHFMVMDSERGRTQTTQGVWMGLSKSESENEEQVFVFDVEGTDSRERGEHHASFEQKTSLLSLALSEILIVNMWHNDIGRYNAGNLALLKTVFELNLQLFQQSRGTSKTLILFVIRDHVSQETPLEKLKSTLQSDMEKIWKDLIKPKGFEDSKVESFFDFQYTGLPHKVLAPELFQKEVRELRKRFLDPKCENYLLGKEYRKDIPSDGFMTFASNIWKIIKDNKDLNLPTQKEMLAKFRCDEIASEIFSKFATDIQPMKSQLSAAQIITDFGKQGTGFHKAALDSYNEPAARYHPDVAKKTGQDLSDRIFTELHSLFVKQLKLLIQKSVASFTDNVKQSMPDSQPAIQEFAKTINGIYDNVIANFKEKAQESVVDSAPWVFDEELAELSEILKGKLSQVRDAQLEKLSKELKETCNRELAKPLDRLLDAPVAEMWPKIREIYFKTKDQTCSQLEDRLKGFDLSEEEIKNRVQSFEDSVFDVLKTRFLEKSKYTDYILHKKFDNVFNIDENGLPRRWKPKDDIGAIFTKAKEEALVVLELFAFLRLSPELDSVVYLKDDSKVESELVILTFDQCSNILEKFEKDAKTTYMQAIRDQEAVATTAHIPVWAILLIVLLGFNEFTSVLFSPFWLLVYILLGGALYAAYFLGYGGPHAKLAVSLLQSSVSQSRQYLLEQYDLHQQTSQKKEQETEEKKNN